MTAPRTPRISLTKLQRDSAAGVELISICRQVTEDGHLTREEVDDLRDWLERYRNTPFASHSYLKAVLERVLADGVVTPEELHEPYTAIEKILPPDLRAEVVARRRARDAVELARNTPLEGWDFMVAGCRYEGRPMAIEMHCRAGDDVFLARDSGNKFSRFAVEVRLASGHQIGYVPETDVRELAPLLDAGHPYRAHVKKILTGGRSPIPVVVTDVYATDASIPGLRRPGDAPAKVPNPEPGRAAGCAIFIVGFLAAEALLKHLWA